MAGSDETSAALKGLDELKADLAKMQRDVYRATRAGAQKSARLVSSSVKKQIKGGPRYGERGKSRVYSETVHVDGATGPRGGPPGKFQGNLRKGVHSTKPVPVGVDSVNVQVKGSTGVSNLYASKVDSKYAFFKPGVDQASPLIRESFNATYASALARYSGRK